MLIPGTLACTRSISPVGKVGVFCGLEKHIQCPEIRVLDRASIYAPGTSCDDLNARTLVFERTIWFSWLAEHISDMT
jgi:hypothetical protein